jgi:outer membrane immunogenic protein
MLISNLTKINAFECRRSATIIRARAGTKKLRDEKPTGRMDMRLLVSGVALVAFLSGSALAADLPRPPPTYKAPPAPQQYFSWAGFYLGTHTGVSVGRTDTNNVFPYGGFDGPNFPRGYELNPVQIFGGGQIGYNWQLGTFVFGGEIDGGYLGNRQTLRQADDLTAVKYGWYGTFTARAGLAYDRLLTYVKGGAVVAQIRNTASDLNSTTGAIDTSDFSQVSSARWGWTIGTGFEYAIASNWTVKSEYLYMDFGTRNSTNIDGDLFNHKNTLNTFKIGLNYKWGGMPGY